MNGGRTRSNGGSIWSFGMAVAWALFGAWFFAPAEGSAQPNFVCSQNHECQMLFPGIWPVCDAGSCVECRIGFDEEDCFGQVCWDNVCRRCDDAAVGGCAGSLECNTSTGECEEPLPPPPPSECSTSAECPGERCVCTVGAFPCYVGVCQPCTSCDECEIWDSCASSTFCANCPPGGGGGGCGEARAATTVLSLSQDSFGEATKLGRAPQGAGSAPAFAVDGLAKPFRTAPIAGSCSGTLSRYDTQDDTQFLMEEWSVVSFSGAESGGLRELQSLGSSSKGHRSLTPECLASDLPALRSAFGRAETVLVIDEPVHPENSRYMPKPEVFLAQDFLEHSGPAARTVYRLDIGKDRTVRGVDQLYASYPVAAGFRQYLAENLVVEYEDERSHRLIVFLVMEVSENGNRLVEALRVLPLCCCGGQFCV